MALEMNDTTIDLNKCRRDAQTILDEWDEIARHITAFSPFPTDEFAHKGLRVKSKSIREYHLDNYYLVELGDNWFVFKSSVYVPWAPSILQALKGVLETIVSREDLRCDVIPALAAIRDLTPDDISSIKEAVWYGEDSWTCDSFTIHLSSVDGGIAWSVDLGYGIIPMGIEIELDMTVEDQITWALAETQKLILLQMGVTNAET